MENEWFSVQGWFRWYLTDSGETDRFEQRVVLFQASDLDDALDKAEAEARSYCQPDPNANFRVESVGIWHAFQIGASPAHGVEVFSRRIETSLSAAEFVARYKEFQGGAV